MAVFRVPGFRRISFSCVSIRGLEIAYEYTRHVPDRMPHPFGCVIERENGQKYMEKWSKSSKIDFFGVLLATAPKFLDLAPWNSGYIKFEWGARKCGRKFVGDRMKNGRKQWKMVEKLPFLGLLPLWAALIRLHFYQGPWNWTRVYYTRAWLNSAHFWMPDRKGKWSKIYGKVVEKLKIYLLWLWGLGGQQFEKFYTWVHETRDI